MLPAPFQPGGRLSPLFFLPVLPDVRISVSRRGTAERAFPPGEKPEKAEEFSGVSCILRAPAYIKNGKMKNKKILPPLLRCFRAGPVRRADHGGRKAVHMFDLDALRGEVLHFQSRERRYWEYDPCALRARLETCPPDAPLCIAWAYAAAGRLDGMIFASAEDEPLVGRVRRAARPEEEFRAAEEWFRNESILKNRPEPGQTGHMEPYLDAVFELGLDGLAEKIARYEADADGEKKETYRSFAIVLEAFSAMIERAAQDAGCPEASERCRRIAHHPPRTFREALQLLWFADIGIQVGDAVTMVGPGRLDERLAPYYENDLKNGTVTYESAVRDIALVYLYVNDWTPGGLAFAVMVGGNTVNELSYAAVEAVRFSRLVYPSVGICVNENTPHDLKRLAADVIAEGYPNPSFFNDRVIRRGLESYGVPAERSAEYINSTCVEITPSGCSNVWVASPYYNLCGILLRTLERECAGFDSFLETYFLELAEEIRRGAENQRRDRLARIANRRRPLQSIFTNDCLERGLDIENGGARCNWVECSFVGLANLVDSLIVIRHEIFEEKNMSQSGMLAVLKDDFKNNEALRRKFLNAYPKYGTDNPEPDSLIPPILGRIRAECGKYRMPPDDALYIPGTFCWIMHQQLGQITCATPDGRRSGFPFADGAGPAQGREKQGPTAAVKSVCSWNHVPMIGGCAFNMKFPKTVLASGEAREKLVSLIDSYIRNGGFQVQINVTDNTTLRKARENPEAYADLVVRIGGYTDYFTRLSEGMQQELLLRTQYSEV